MATVAHYIRSHYDPEDRERLEKETGQHDEPEHGVDPDAAWQREAAQIERRRPPPPRFVPATISDGDWTHRDYGSSMPSGFTQNPLGSTVSGWYRSMTVQDTRIPANPCPSQMSSTSTSVQPKAESEPPKRKMEKRNKNNWFIMKAIESEPSSSTASPAPSLADILARDPPPLPSEGKFTPPVFLGIGPANKGFGMLQRAGWNEGEPLGPDVIRRKPVEDLLLRNDGDLIRNTPSTSTSKLKGKDKAYPVGHNVQEVKMEDFGDVSELRKVEVIDLTLSDSDEEEVQDEEGDESEELRSDERESSHEGEIQQTSTDVPQVSSTIDNTPYARKALITPIATVLKSDRLGIGLKAKTVGPHKASQKRVTHGAAALAAHVRAAEEARKKKSLYGRGRRGFERQRKREEEHRQALLAQLKSPW
ncbi:hypothetical protein D9619_007183 [Psilocybe cf. subviscida]|uniref:G-patch domain-containing protein n=1 Tax=Psilocybe cf. subviscida TaxID=2480587 RepID=A0A8H5B227_9AGAR|nr:hypothetical protein D9619_007183 [Psilocybe cf. subviscida]